MARPRLHENQVDIDVSLARRLLAEQLPEYAARSLRQVPSGGTENAVFRLGSNPSMVAVARRGLAEVLADLN